MAPNGDSHQAIRELRVLAEIERDPQVSQRGIAERVGIALGLTNTILRRLVRKGLVTTRTLRANRLAYYLTPKGLADRTRLFVDYVRTTTNFFCIVRNVILEKLRFLHEQHDVRSVAIVEINELADAVYLAAKELGLEVAGAYDAARAGSRWLGIEVQAPNGAIPGDVLMVMDLGGAGPPEARPARPDAVVVHLTEILAADLRRFAQGFE